MNDLSYFLDDNEVSVNTFREDPERCEAEDFLVDAYTRAIGDIKCQAHDQGAAYALHYDTNSGECRIRTVACCPAFDHTMNMALMQQVTAEADS